MTSFIRAEQGLHHSVIYEDEAGKLFQYSGGTWGWRNHNPGNLRPGKISRRNHAIGKAGGFAVFPNYEAGREALIDCLQSLYGNKSIDKMVSSYAPSIENNVKQYREFLHQRTGVGDDKKIKDFSLIEFTKLINAIEAYEGYKAGLVKEIYRITQVKKNHHGLCSFYVESMGWLSKHACVSLANEGMINLIVCHAPTGEKYIRARSKDPFQKKLTNLITPEACDDSN